MQQFVASSAANTRLIVADDDPANRLLLTTLLVGWGYNAEAFSDGASALQQIVKQPPDLVLLDVDMPGKNGYEVCRTLKREKALSAIPVIFISSLNSESDKATAFEAGAAEYLTKPFDVEELHACLRRQLSIG